MVINFENLDARPNFALKDFQKYFSSKDFNAQKIFLDFCKNRKGVRKDSSMQWCFENSNMQWEKSKKSKEIMMESKHEIHTDLLSARARRFESDERDLSPALTYHCSARPGDVDEDELSTLRHTFLGCLLLDWVVVGTSGWGSGEPQSACPSLSCCIMKRSSSLCLNLKNMSSFPTRKWISPLPTSILDLADLRKGRPSMRSTPW